MAIESRVRGVLNQKNWHGSEKVTGSEERPPKSGLPDLGTYKLSKSATADFDGRVSKDGHALGARADPTRTLRTRGQARCRR
jgi:hypothetical protein